MKFLTGGKALLVTEQGFLINCDLKFRAIQHRMIVLIFLGEPSKFTIWKAPYASILLFQ